MIIVERILTGVAASLLLLLIIVTCADVIGRYLLGMPLAGAFELTQLLLAALVFSALPIVSKARAHVEVDLLVGVLPAYLSKALGIFGNIVSAIMLGFFAWQLWILAGHQWADGAGSVSLGIPYAPLGYFAAICCLIAAMASVLGELGND